MPDVHLRFQGGGEQHILAPAVGTHSDLWCTNRVFWAQYVGMSPPQKKMIDSWGLTCSTVCNVSSCPVAKKEKKNIWGGGRNGYLGHLNNDLLLNVPVINRRELIVCH